MKVLDDNVFAIIKSRCIFLMMKWYIWNESYMNCGYEIKWSYDLRSYERNFCNCVEKPEKFRTSTISYPQFIYDSFHIYHFIYTSSYIPFHHWFIPHGTIRTHKWPAPNVSGFIAQLVTASHRNREVTGSNSLEVLNSFDWSFPSYSFLRLQNCKFREDLCANSPKLTWLHYQLLYGKWAHKVRGRQSGRNRAYDFSTY